MAYTSTAQVITRWGTNEVTLSADRDPQDGVPDNDAIETACADASSLMDSYFARGGYETPVPVTDVVALKATDIAIYLLSQGPGALTDEKRRRYDDAIAWLKEIAEGKTAELPDGPVEGQVARSARTGGGYPLKYQAGQLRGGGLL